MRRGRRSATCLPDGPHARHVDSIRAQLHEVAAIGVHREQRTGVRHVIHRSLR